MSGGGDVQKTPTGAANDNCLSNGEQGREVPKVFNNAEDNLNFGWFSLPRDGQNTGGSRQGSRPASVSGWKLQGGRQASQAGAGPPIQHSRPPSQSRGNQQQDPAWGTMQAQAGGSGGPETHLPPLSRQGCLQQKAGDSQRLLVSDDPDMADFERPDNNNQQQMMGSMADQDRGRVDDSTGVQGLRPEIDAVDWPLSRAAQEMLMRQAHPPAEPGYAFLDKQGMSSRPASRRGTPSVPPVPQTPMPPLQWNGYKGSNRPTFASWHERWHRDPHCQAHCPTGRHQMGAEQPYNMFSDFNNNHNGDASSAETNGGGTSKGRSATVLAAKIKCNNNNSSNNHTDNRDSKYVIKNDRLDFRENQGSYWSKHRGEGHITNIGTEFIGYDGSIFRPVKSPRHGANFAKKGRYSVVSFPTGVDKSIQCAKKELSLACRKRIRKRASAVDPNVQPDSNGLRTGRSGVAGKCEDEDFVKEGSPKHGKPINKKTSFALNFLSRIKSFKHAASCWGKKIRSRCLTRNTYCHFENDF